VDEKFCGTYTQQLSEVLVAGVAAGNGGKSALWNAGDVLVLVGDSYDARLMVYAQTKLYYGSGKNIGLLNLGALPLSQPTSTPIPWAKFHAESATPAGMDIWPANPTWHTNTTLLFTTADGRVLEFDTLLNKFVCNFTENRGAGLQKIKVGSYAGVSYAFVAQLEAHNTGQILVFVAAPATGPNNPIKTISAGIMNPVGLAVTSAASTPLPAGTHGAGPCTTNPCVIDPLGPELVTTIYAAAGDHLTGTVLEQNCIVTTDPRVTFPDNAWTCNQTSLPIGAGTNICPSFPSAVIPGSVCGHSGPTESGFAVIEGTALGIDPNDNNSFITTAGNVDAVLPGATNLECTPFSGQIPLIAWGTRSDLTTVEGTIAEDTNGSYGASLGGTAGFLTELTGGCDTSTTGSRGISIFAIGLGLSYTNPSDIYNLVEQKYGALVQTLNGADLTDGGTVYNTLYNYFSAAAGYAYSASVAVNPSPAFTNDINCALNQIATADSYLRQSTTLAAFESNLVTSPPGGGNPNPAGEIDGRLASWYTAINTLYAGNAPYVTWPLPPSSVPVCASSTQTQITSFSWEPSGDSDNLMWNTLNAASCTLTTLYALNNQPSGYNFLSTQTSTGGPDFLFNTDYPIGGVDSGYSMSTPPDVTPGWGSDTYTLTCYSADGTQAATASILNASGFTPPQTPPPLTPLAITSFTTDPPGGAIGYVAWTTVNSTGQTVCTITDEFGGPPYYQTPTGGLPANMYLPETDLSPNEMYPYSFYEGGAFCPGESPAPTQNTDTITLTCSDPTNGTAISTLTLSNPGCGG